MSKFLLSMTVILALLSCEEPEKKAQYVESTAKPVDTSTASKDRNPGPSRTGGDADLEKTEKDPEGEDEEPGLEKAPATDPGKSATASNGKPYCKNNSGQGYGSEFDCGGLRCKKDDGSTYSETSICVIASATTSGGTPPPAGGSTTGDGGSTGSGSYLNCSGNSYCSGGYGWLKEGESGCKSGVTGFQPDKAGCSCKC